MQNQYGKTLHINCHESGLWPSARSPPEVTHSLHGLLHYTTVETSPKTTFPIIHCTDVTHTAVSTDQAHTWESSHNYTVYLNLGLPLALGQVLFSDCYSTERSPVVSLPC